MSEFSCPVVRVAIEPHPNGDAIELAIVGGYRSIVKKGQFKDGDLAVYIPEQSVLPKWLLEKMGFWDTLNCKGQLSGSAGNRVRAMKLRGVLSQGLLYPVSQIRQGPVDGAEEDFTNIRARVFGRPITAEEATTAGKLFLAEDLKLDEDECAAEFLGVQKYEPVVPLHMAGRIAGGDLDATISYDFENLKKVPHLFDDGMEVAITEKIHGTLLQVGLIPKAIYEGKSWAEKSGDFIDCAGEIFAVMVTSKGQGAEGLIISLQDTSNLYVKLALQLRLPEKLALARIELNTPSDQPIFAFGEIFGVGVQDLAYGQTTPAFRAFDIYLGTRSHGGYLDFLTLAEVAFDVGLDMVPVLAVGPYSHALVQQHTNGNSTIPGAENQIREGVVIKATVADCHPRFGRRIAKSVADAYLLRKHGTEFA
jgi:RNA ligase (TIGR02306 family)